MAYIDIKGVFPPMITPFKENGDVDYEGHVKNLKKWNEFDLAGYVVLGSNSETVYLTEDEKLKLVELTVKHSKKNSLTIAGTGMESTLETIKLTNKVAKLGAHMALVLTPFYYGEKMNDEALINFYKDVADNVDIPILIYNVTKFTHINISPYAVGVLSKHPNIIGMKDSSGSVGQLINYKNSISDDFNLIVGTASAWYPALTLDIKAAVMALANCAPMQCIEIQKAFEKGDYEKSKELYLRMFPVNAAVTATFGIAGLKYACSLLGYSSGFVRKPLLELKEEEKDKIREVLNKARLI